MCARKALETCFSIEWNTGNTSIARRVKRLAAIPDALCGLHRDSGACQSRFHFGGPQTRGVVFHHKAIERGSHIYFLYAVNRVCVRNIREHSVVQWLLQPEANLHLGHSLYLSNADLRRNW